MSIQTMKRHFLTAGLALLALAGTARGEVTTKTLKLIGGDQASQQAYFAQPIRIWGSNGYMSDPRERFSMITLSNARISYVFGLSGKVDEQGNLKANLGMERPTSANWYHGGFFQFKVNGNTERTCTVQQLDSKDGELKLLYSGKDMTARLTIRLPDQDDKLLLSFEPEVRNGVADGTYQVGFLCYPSSLAGGYAQGLKLRQREAISSERTFTDCAQETLREGECWVLFYDRWFDPALNRGAGGCALMYNPKRCKAAEVNMGNYACDMQLVYALKQPAQVILWDFTGWGNQSAKDYMKSLRVTLDKKH